MFKTSLGNNWAETLKSQKYILELQRVSLFQINHHNTVEFLVCVVFLVLLLYSRCLIKFMMKWDQFMNNYQNFTLGGPMKKQFLLQSCFFYVLPRHTNKVTDKGFNLFASRFVHLSPQEEESTSSY